MRHASVVVRASVAFIVATSVGACAATAPSPSIGDPTATAHATASAVSSPEMIESPTAPTSASPSSAAIPAEAGIVTRIQVGVPVEPRWFAADDQSLWVHEPTSLVRVDLATSAVTGRVPLNWMEYGYDASGAGAVWQTDYENNALLRIDPVTSRVVARIPVGLQPLGVVVTAGSVWVANEHSESVSRVDPKTNRVIATILIGPAGPAGPQIMTAGPGGVWVDVPNLGEVVRIDAATNKVGLVVPMDGPVASDGKQVWISVDPETDGGVSKVVRIDPVSGKVITTVDGGGNLAIGLGSVWAGTTRIDEATGQIVGTFDIGDDGGDITVAGGSLWVTADGKPYVVRVVPR